MSPDLEKAVEPSRNDAETAANADAEAPEMLYERDTARRRPRPWYHKYMFQIGIVVLGICVVVVILVVVVQIVFVEHNKNDGRSLVGGGVSV